MHKQRSTPVILLILLVLCLLPAEKAYAQGPDGAELVVADWLVLSFLVFFSVTLLMLLVVAKRGLLSNLEDAKYHILTIHEPDYYTPEWAKEEKDGPDPNRQ